MKQPARIFALLGLATVLAGCTNATAEEGWRTPEVPEDPPSVQLIGALPFDSFKLSSAEREQIQIGTAELLGRCLSNYGFTPTFSGDYIKQVSDVPDDPFFFQWGGLWGTLPLEQAREYGYAAPPGAEWVNGSAIYISTLYNLFPASPGNADPTEAARLSGAMYGPDQAIVFGEGGAGLALAPELLPKDDSGHIPPEKGCYGLVEDEIGIPLTDLGNLESDAYGLTFNHNAVKDLAKKWSRCMKDAGYDYARFEEAPSANSGAINKETIAAAVADVNCTESTHWPDIFYYILADYQQQAIDKQPELFQSALDAERKRLAKINKILGE